MKKVIGIGETVWDVFPSGKRLGGAPVNFSFFAKEFGAEAYPVTAIGNDALGDETLEALKATGLNLGYIQRNDKPQAGYLSQWMMPESLSTRLLRAWLGMR